MMHITLGCLHSHPGRPVSAPQKAEPVLSQLQICVCPRVNMAEPCTLGIRSISAASGRIWLICTSIRTLVILQDHLADSLFLVLINSFITEQPATLRSLQKLLPAYPVISRIFSSRICFTSVNTASSICFRGNDLFDRFKQFFRNRTAAHKHVLLCRTLQRSVSINAMICLVDFMSLVKIASIIFASGTSLAPASIMITFSLVEATVRCQIGHVFYCC